MRESCVWKKIDKQTDRERESEEKREECCIWKDLSPSQRFIDQKERSA
jgi:hypothetical protein